MLNNILQANKLIVGRFSTLVDKDYIDDHNGNASSESIKVSKDGTAITISAKTPKEKVQMKITRVSRDDYYVQVIYNNKELKPKNYPYIKLIKVIESAFYYPKGELEDWKPEWVKALKNLNISVNRPQDWEKCLDEVDKLLYKTDFIDDLQTYARAKALGRSIDVLNGIKARIDKQLSRLKKWEKFLPLFFRSPVTEYLDIIRVKLSETDKTGMRKLDLYVEETSEQAMDELYDMLGAWE